MRVTGAEDIAGNNQHIVGDGFGAKIAGGDTVGRFGEDVKSPVGTIDLESFGEQIVGNITFALVGVRACSMGLSTTARAAYCNGEGAQTNVYCCNLVIWAMIWAGPAA